MKKIETVWCQLLFDALERREFHFQQQKFASTLHMSVSTVHHAIGDLRRFGAVSVGGDGGNVTDIEKLLMHWASHRQLIKDVVATVPLALPVLEVEGLLPVGSILGGYSAVRHWYGEAPADYTSVYVYHKEPAIILDRFGSQSQGGITLTVLKLPPYIPYRPETTTLAHTFVDLWNMTDWMARVFIKRIQEEIDGLLS